jgi:hypothetical protein
MTVLIVIWDQIYFCKIFLCASNNQNVEMVISPALRTNFAMSVRIVVKHVIIHQMSVIHAQEIVFLMIILISVIVQSGLLLILYQLFVLNAVISKEIYLF